MVILVDGFFNGVNPMAPQWRIILVVISAFKPQYSHTDMLCLKNLFIVVES
jgi:hypothetical protein